jgi:pimeloyl-ACP methyl ester carboxylesterase
MARAAGPLADQMGVRLLAPDRPGFGRSTPAPGRTFTSCAEDTRQLLDALELERVGVWCQSGGAPFAIALTARHPSRVHHLGIAAGMAPMDAPGVTEGMSLSLRLSLWTARHATRMLEWQFRALRAVHRRSPERAAWILMALRPPEDRTAVSEPELWPVLVASMSELVQAPAATAEEMRLISRPWDVDPAEVTVPTTVWHGTRDTVHPPAMGRYLAERIPGATLHLIEGMATFDLLARRDEMLRTIAPEPERPQVRDLRPAPPSPAV